MTTPRPVPPHQVVALDLRGRTALVTGAGSGIGRSVAGRLAAAGARVVAVDRDAEPLRSLADDTGAVPVVADLSDPDRAEEALEGHRDVDVLVNNAGLQHVAPLEEFPPERFAHIQTVMVEAPFRLIRLVLPHMYSAGWGRIVNISSVHGLRASPFKAAYVTAKHALEGLSKTVALEGAAHGVTANCVNPAYVRTPLVEGQISAQAATHGIPEAEVIEKIMLTSSAIKRLIEPEEVAELVAYLCTDAAGFITGTSVAIDGAWTAH
ncbi:3-hydroxybutyrate dehydrogenase [Dactylosporangium roseum]|uniref:3-hydroxybutyrate dehydrogenase n=1 Tax=Dactylosporangium roseum TaxID=47989 RepID=A0ABY5Z257_9ACTN|nr:3-hydroxybutyrate dehydrogenase [Dactylosporangium roseum]UWZ34962.1 3-hydroxybutyrate dehydrogenase [Dactylosporangium roseum]